MSISNFFDMLVLGMNYPKHDAFLKEFADYPEAETLRILYRRVLLFINLSLAVILYVVRSYGIEPNGTLLEWFIFRLSFFMNVGIGAVLIHDQDFARFIVSRRIRLATLNHPRTAEKMLWFCLPPETADEAIDHLNLKFQDRKARYSTAYARRWYWWQLIRLFIPSLDQFAERAIKWGIFEWVRRELFK